MTELGISVPGMTEQEVQKPPLKQRFSLTGGKISPAIIRGNFHKNKKFP
jgi:hypothetical protein